MFSDIGSARVRQTNTNNYGSLFILFYSGRLATNSVNLILMWLHNETSVKKVHCGDTLPKCGTLFLYHPSRKPFQRSPISKACFYRGHYRF